MYKLSRNYVKSKQPLIPNPDVTNDIIRMGGEDLLICFQCGACTAICPISEELNTNFRRSIKYAQLGLEEKLLSDVTPWLCHACGECSETCPRGANPSNILAAIRRYLISRYDWTGFSRRFMISKKVEVLGVLLLAFITFLGAYFLHGPIITTYVALETFAPLKIVETAGILVFLILAGILSINIYRMYRYVMGDLPKEVKIPRSVYLKELIKLLPMHFFTQKYMKECERNRLYWVIHLLLFYGYGFAFVLFVILLRFVQTNEPFLFVKPLSVLGIISMFALFSASILIIYGRLTKKIPIWERSHSVDWMFILLLFITTLTGALVGIFRTLNMPLLTYYTFVIHLMVAAPFLILEVPFAKWSHLAYRPFAIYFYKIKEYVLKESFKRMIEPHLKK